jgi:DNA-binding response OmpR family regulator
MLPKMDGYKVCAMLKRDAKYQKIPIIMLTARAQESDEKLGLECGADAFITKPFQHEIVLAKIRELLEKL